MSKKELLERIETLERQVCWLQTEMASLKKYQAIQYIPSYPQPPHKPPTDPPYVITCDANTVAGE
jgi:hypothetical protein